MSPLAVALLCATFAFAPVASAQTPNTPNPDTLLVFKNGAEVKGVFVELKDAQYKMRLPDGRVMSYAADDVVKMERLPLPSTPSSSSSQSNPSSSPIDPASCSIFITEKQIDKTFYAAVGDVTVSKKWYGSTSEMFGELADSARKIGAEAVIGVHTWHAPSGFSWAAPHAGGMAVKFTEAGRKALPNLEGRCY